ncbi:MAG TPA: molybdate ABC transporter substrate-binding protein [Aquabacterium sp.]|nr:molybdate ABC transporter substrate-binding protein [Aquabacterium sp.]
MDRQKPRLLSRIFKALLSLVACVACAQWAHAADVTVSAAASLSNAFKDLARAYETRYPQSKVLLNFGASGALVQQMAKGAPVDVFASADQETMLQAQRQLLVAPRSAQTFARNSLVVIVPAGSSHKLAGLSDLIGPGTQRLAVGSPASVPAGRYAKRALEIAQLWTAVQPKLIFTQNVRQSLDYVARGEVDAGFVYLTDAVVMKDKVSVAFAVPLDEPVSYPIAPIVDSRAPQEARRFIEFVLSPAGWDILARHGFLQP